MILQVRAAREVFSDNIKLLLFEGGLNDRMIAVVLPVDKFTLKETREGDPVEASMSLPASTAQSLVDALAEIGITSDLSKKKEEKFSGVLEATKSHLVDMQKLVFERRIK
jgi:hypothetical protein